MSKLLLTPMNYILVQPRFLWQIFSEKRTYFPSITKQFFFLILGFRGYVKSYEPRKEYFK